MRNSFAALGKNRMTRKFGGTIYGVAQPYITGAFYIYFTNLPTALTTYCKNLGSNLSSLDDIQRILTASCTGVTPPGGTLNKVEFTGLGGVKWAVPGNIDYGNSISLKFMEFSKTPIGDIFHSWIKVIRDYRLGVSEILDETESGTGYMKQDYAATLYYWTVAPDGQEPEYYACYDGVFPTKDPQELYSSDLETVGKLDVEIEFNVDYAWHEPWVLDKVQTLSDEIYGDSNTIIDIEYA